MEILAGYFVQTAPIYEEEKKKLYLPNYPMSEQASYC